MASIFLMGELVCFCEGYVVLALKNMLCSWGLFGIAMQQKHFQI